MLTHDRVHLLRQCVENALLRTSLHTREIVIWDNASTDGTGDYLESLDEPRIRVVRHPENIGQSAYTLAFRETTCPFMIEVDDDIIDAPHHWDATLLQAFLRAPRTGYLAANLANNPKDLTAHYMYERNAALYTVVEENGVLLKLGPTGGWCTMTSRELHDRVGGFRQNKKYTWWLEDAAYIKDIEKLGYRAACLVDLEVAHAGGPYYSGPSPEKDRYMEDHRRRVEQKNRIKRILLAVPLVARLNIRFGWFQPPSDT